MKKYTNNSPGMRGITVNSPTGPFIHYLESGQSVSFDPKDVIAVPDLGKPPAGASADGIDLATENAELKKQVADLAKERDALLAENAELKKEPEAEPGPLDQSIEKLTEHLATVTDADEVQKLLDAETAGKSRTGAIAALEARRDELLA